MATTSSEVYWSKDYTLSAGAFDVYRTTNYFSSQLVDFTATPEPPHELEVIQRMSEAFHGLIRQGLI